MVTYESSGSLTTVARSFPSPQTPDLSGLVYTLNTQSISVNVVGSPGTASEEIVTQSLGGASSYGLTWTSAHTDFEVVFSLSTADTSQTPQVDDLTLQGQPNAPSISVSEVTDTPDITLSWPAVDTADEYRVYRSTSPGTTLGDYTQIDTTTTTGFTDTTASLGTRYYYRVTAYNTSTGESEASNEVRAEPNADEFTESIAWDSEREWQYGSFSDATTDGVGTLLLGPRPSETFDYSISGDSAGVTSTVEIRDAGDSTVLASDSTTGGSITSTFTIDTTAHPSLEFYAEVDDNDGVGSDSGSASISLDGATLVSASGNPNGTTLDTDTATRSFTYAETGAWTSPYWDFTNTTTATKLSWSGVTFPNAGDSITVTVENAAGTSTHTETLSSGSGSALFEIAPDDQYRVVVTLDTADDNTTPEIGSVTLEAHTPTTGHTVVDTRQTEVDLSWSEIPVCDGYEVYYAKQSGVSEADTLGFDTTDPSVTSGTVTGLEQGGTYHFNVRTQYNGE